LRIVRALGPPFLRLDRLVRGGVVLDQPVESLGDTNDALRRQGNPVLVLAVEISKVEDIVEGGRGFIAFDWLRRGQCRRGGWRWWSNGTR
jgi:hypothetical protein